MRRTISNAALFVMMITFWASPGIASAQRAIRANEMIDLQEQLETGLRARLPAEFTYLEEIVHRVEGGQIPQSLVRSTFAYARKKRPYPIQYFDRALRIRGEKQGITTIPALKINLQTRAQ